MTLGKRLASLRQSKNLTQTELSALTFISRSRLALYETDKREPDLQTLKQLANFYSVSIDYLLENALENEDHHTTCAAIELYTKFNNTAPESRRVIEILLGLDKEIPDKKAN